MLHGYARFTADGDLVLDLHKAEAEKNWFKDPYDSQLVVTIANHWVVHKLGGWGPVFATEKLTRNDFNTVWDDRVLNRACRVFRGVPLVTLEAANALVPDSLKKRLGGMVTPPA